MTASLSSVITDARGQGNHSFKVLREDDLKTSSVPNYHSRYFQRVTNFTSYAPYLNKLLKDILQQSRDEKQEKCPGIEKFKSQKKEVLEFKLSADLESSQSKSRQEVHGL